MEAPTTAYQPPLPEHLDFDQLRDGAIARLQTFAGARWTDYNAHDPGITLLEALCYVLTELGYRAGYSIPDLLAGETGSFFRPEQALPGVPVSADDLLRYLYTVSDAVQLRLDALQAGEQRPELFFYLYGDTGAIGMEAFPGAQAIPLHGLYQLSVGKWPYNSGDAADSASRDLDLVRALHRVRGLCTDFVEPPPPDENADTPKPLFQTLTAIHIPLYLTLDISPVVNDPENFAQTLLVGLAREITRTPQLQNPADKPANVPAETWHDLPAGRGYLPPEALERLRPRAALYASDLAQWLMDQPGVENVRRISFKSEEVSLVYLLSPDQIPALDIDETATTLQLLRHGLATDLDGDKIKTGATKDLSAFTLNMFPAVSAAYTPAAGRDRKTGKYHSIRHDLPALYGITQGDDEGFLPEPAARRKQFSAYLLFFEQILADNFAQMDYGRRLFDLRQPVPEGTYAHRNLQDLPLAGAVLDAAYEDLSVETDPETRLRRLYDHLIARVGEQTYVSEPAKKLAFLQNWPDMSAKRSLGIDYTDPSAAAPLEARIQALLGLEGDEPFYLVENILLRSLDGDQPDDEGNWLTFVPRPDPFSLRVSCVLPASGGRFAVENGNAGHNFRAFVCRIIREEVPAHIAIDWLWLPPDHMTAFAVAWQEYRKLLSSDKVFARRVARDAVLDKLIERQEQNSPGMTTAPYFLIGWPAPLLNIPAHQDGFAEPFGTAAIKLEYSQPGTLYILCDRNGNMLMPADGGITQSIANAIYKTGAGGALTLETPTLGDEDTTFCIKVVKIAGESDSGTNNAIIRSGYLQRKVRIRVGIRADLETRWHPSGGILSDPLLVAYGQPAGVRIENVQAEVEYYLVDDDGTDLCAPGFSGSEGGDVVVISNSLLKDIRVHIEARRTIGNTKYTKSFAQPEHAGWIFVGPNPDLAMMSEPLLPYGGTAIVKIQGSQAGVNYHLDYRDIADHEFIHNGTMVTGDLTEPVHLRLAKGYGWLMTRTGPIVGTGGEITFEVPGLTEDTCFFATAVKERYHLDGAFFDQSVSLNSPVATILSPNPAVSFPIAERTVQAGEVLEIPLIAPQRGVFYQLVRADAANQPIGPKVYLHDTHPASPRQDGIGLLALAYYSQLIPTPLGSKVGVDFVVGPPLDIEEMTLISAPLTVDTPALQVGVVAIKAQTQVSVRLNGAFALNIKSSGGRLSAPVAPKNTPKPRAPRKPRKP